MVVIFLTHNYPREPGDLAGAFLHTLAQALADRGHEVRVVAPADRGRGGRQPLDGIPVRRVRYARADRETLGYGGMTAGALRSPGGLLCLTRLIRALRRGARAEAAEPSSHPAVQPPSRPAVPSGPPAALVHAHWWFPAGLAAPRRLPLVITLHGTDVRLFERSAARRLGRRVLGRARLVTAVSPELARIAEAVSGRQDISAHVQPMPVNSEGFPWSGGGGGLIVVARLTAQKRVHLAIEAVGALAARGHPIPLTIIGEGPERAALQRLAESLRLPVQFLGALPHRMVITRLERADAMLFPAREEGLGLAAVEALMIGVPVVVCRDGGGTVSAIGRHGGGVVTDPEPSGLAQAARAAGTPAAREQARHAGSQWRAELAPSKVAERWETWYEAALAS
ncbi:MAG: glycosyltransferase family 4 protein [Gemmatimonadales bacterium]